MVALVWLALVLHRAAAFAPHSLPSTMLTCRVPQRSLLCASFESRMVRMPIRLGLLINDLKEEGASKEMLEEAFAKAMATAFPGPESYVPAAPDDPDAPDAPDAPSVSVAPAPLERPATVSAAHAAFHGAYTGTVIKSVTQKFLNFIIEDCATIYRFNYNRVYALGFATLCDAFLATSCFSEADVQATKKALCFGLGMEASAVWADAAELSLLAQGMCKADLFESADFAQLRAEAKRTKYSYALGVGLVLLMRAVGETALQSMSGTYGAPATASTDDGAIQRWCAELGLTPVFVKRLSADTERPISIDGAGRFSFERTLEEESLVSIGIEGSF
eukprot:CAMPEP_0183353302 /NCGR_PEP_ID=MMETSP0164_2-20130417/33179_1 /TAXON_ID=221442 /ORGANISM="Coccolithus pelagicus ssp braarudi, Strain PLY182g" /LENGTH=332 /DNA_ID=CAMNT_0025525957 /DNA_START=20 /DNA_END=1018 /DNA_ORIENTATION=+